MKKIAIITLGCPKNLVDSETMAGLLAAEGYDLVALPQQADAIIVNTCGFIGEARKESVETILEMAQFKNDKCSKLYVTGCLSQGNSRDLMKEIPEIDGILGTGSVDRICELLAGQKEIFLPPNCYDGRAETNRLLSTYPYGYLKIAEGCDNHCSYCVIPQLRGGLRSKEIKQILAEVDRMAAIGIKEIVLIAQDTSQYGVDIDGKSHLRQLLMTLESSSYEGRFRLLYCHPDHITSELIDFFAISNKFCCYLDIPFQHSHPEILANMGRAQGLPPRELVARLRDRIPNIALRSSFIVGYPNESEMHFLDLLDFINWAKFDHVGAFPFSPERGTKAGMMSGQVSAKVKKKRYHRLMTCQQQIVSSRNESLKGKTFHVLIDNVRQGVASGRSYREAPEIDSSILFPSYQWVQGDFVQVKCSGYRGYDLLGEIDNG